MKVSIITATYNSALSILDAVSSVHKQTYSNIEHIVVDGGSSDNTLALVRGVDSRVSQVVSEPDEGIYDALNKGICLAKGDVIGLVHSDDMLACPRVLEQVNRVFDETGADGVFGDLEYVAKSDTSKVIRYWKSCEFKPWLLKRGWMPAHPTLYLKREVYDKHGFFDKSFKIAADYDFILRVMSDVELQFAYLPQVIVKMRVGGASNRSLKNIIQKSKEDYRALSQNNVGGLGALAWKNLSKLSQFFPK